MPQTITRFADLDGTPLDVSTLTIGQVVESAYAWANGDIDDATRFVAADAVSPSEAFASGDTLLQFLLQELVEGPPKMRTTRMPPTSGRKPVVAARMR